MTGRLNFLKLHWQSISTGFQFVRFSEQTQNSWPGSRSRLYTQSMLYLLVMRGAAPSSGKQRSETCCSLSCSASKQAKARCFA
jgi:hypothetical protein